MSELVNINRVFVVTITLGEHYESTTETVGVRWCKGLAEKLVERKISEATQKITLNAEMRKESDSFRRAYENQFPPPSHDEGNRPSYPSGGGNHEKFFPKIFAARKRWDQINNETLVAQQKYHTERGRLLNEHLESKFGIGAKIDPHDWDLPDRANRHRYDIEEFPLNDDEGDTES